MSEGLPPLVEEGGVDADGTAEPSLTRLDINGAVAPTWLVFRDAHATVASKLKAGMLAKSG